MIRSTLPSGVKTLQKWYANGQLVFDNAIQRSSGQWGILQKSLLIHSILAGYPIPPVFLLKYKNDDATMLNYLRSVMMGYMLQRVNMYFFKLRQPMILK